VARLSVEPAMVDLPYPGTAEVELAWAPRAPLGADAAQALVFVHLLDDTSTVVRTYDHPYPEDWQPGGETRYTLTLYQSLLGPPLPPGEYRLTLGLYGAQGRWALEGGEEVGRQEYAMGRVRVPEPSPDRLPRLDFSEGWAALEPGLDRQILATRWLGREGTVRVESAPQAGRLTFRVEIPAGLAGANPVFEEGEQIPRLTVTSTCDDGAHSISGTGRSEIMVKVPAGGGCEVRFDPNFRYAAAGVTGEEEAARSVRLQQLFWQPTAG
jgi:hypothetical protein